MPFGDGLPARTRFWIGAVALAACAAAPGQTGPLTSAPSVTTQATAETIWLRVTADDVNVRSRPDANSVPVARVERDAVLRAVGRDSYGWYRLIPPEGVFSYVAKEYVDRRGPGEGLVSVRSGTLRVRVGSLVRELDPLQSEVQALLESGATVRIVGEQGDWLKIAPPAGVYAFVFGDHVEAIGEEVAVRESAPSAAAAQPVASQPAAVRTADVADRPTTQPADVSTRPTTRPADGPDLTGPWGQRLLLAETAIEVEGRKPLLEQSWTEAFAWLRPIAAQREAPMVARLAQAWTAQLTQRMSEQDAVRDAEEVLRRAARDQAQHERELERIERARQAASRSAFAARGELLRSDAVGARDGKRWYKLQDPVTKRVEAYVEVDPQSRLDAERLVGQYVGVRGRRRTEPGWGADVVRADEIVVLERAEPATQPATPAARQGS